MQLKNECDAVLTLEDSDKSNVNVSTHTPWSFSNIFCSEEKWNWLPTACYYYSSWAKQCWARIFLKKEKKPGFDQRLEKGNITHDDAFTSAVNNLSTSVCFLTIARLAPMSALQFFCCLLAFLFLYRCNQDKLFVINRWMCCEKQRSWYNLCGRYNLISVRSNDKILLNKTQSTIF